MKFISILISLSLILVVSCNKNPADDDDVSNVTGGGTTGGTTGGGEINYSICENCIWLQEDCNGGWFLGYNIDSPIGGIQFNVEGEETSINGVSGGVTEEVGFTLTYDSESPTVLGFSFSGASIPAGSGTLCILDLEGSPAGLSNIVFADPDANSLIISYYGIINCYYSLLENTGESQLTIFSDSITSLNPGDQIGIFDLNAILNYNDCSNQRGELLVGAGVWDGSQLNIVSTGSVDLCGFGGPQLAGFIEGNEIVVKVYRPSDGLEYSTELSWETGSGLFNTIIVQSINNINLINPSLPKGFF